MIQAIVILMAYRCQGAYSHDALYEISSVIVCRILYFPSNINLRKDCDILLLSCPNIALIISRVKKTTRNIWNDINSNTITYDLNSVQHTVDKNSGVRSWVPIVFRAYYLTKIISKNHFIKLTIIRYSQNFLTTVTDYSFCSCSFGSLKADIRLDFIRNATLPNRRLLATVRRGYLGDLKVNPDSLQITKLGK